MPKLNGYIHAGTEKEPPITLGLYVDHESGKPRIFLCELAENEGRLVVDDLPGTLRWIKRDLFPYHSFDDIEWIYMCRNTATKINVAETFGHPEKWSFTNILAFHNAGQNRMELTEYDNQLNRYIQNLWTHNWAQSRSALCVPLNSAKGHIFMECPEQKDFIRVDYSTFLPAWQQQLRTFFNGASLADIQAEYDRQSTSYNDALLQVPFLTSAAKAEYHMFLKSPRNLQENLLNLRELPALSYRPDIFPETPFSFSNGRHRTINLAAMGAPYIPMIISTSGPEVRENFIEKFAFRPSPGRH